ncbi:NAD-dependent epimerase/dehydratase family protein [Candidatus Woesearchaeota archaeon]|nr:NAD-dependent epimerase/dehydratase family protein [Candidatus Woesearchaeota archaeon]
MKVLVTGATGFIGEHLVKELHRRKFEVIGISKNNPNKKLRCDIMDYKKLKRIFQKYSVDSVIHLAAFISDKPEDKEKMNLINVNGTKNVLKAAVSGNIKGFIYISSMSIYDKRNKIPINEESAKNPRDYYGLTKLRAEKTCMNYRNKFNIIILRYAGVFGCGKNHGAAYNFAANALQSKDLYIQEDGLQTHDFIYVKDAVWATLLALNNLDKIKFGIFNIGSGQEYSVKKLAEIIARQCSSKSKIISNFGSGKPERFLLDISKAKKILGYRPHSVEENVKDFIRELKCQKYL